VRSDNSGTCAVTMDGSVDASQTGDVCVAVGFGMASSRFGTRDSPDVDTDMEFVRVKFDAGYRKAGESCRRTSVARSDGTPAKSEGNEKERDKYSRVRSRERVDPAYSNARVSICGNFALMDDPMRRNARTRARMQPMSSSPHTPFRNISPAPSPSPIVARRREGRSG
jgi:hypothetical protein